MDTRWNHPPYIQRRQHNPNFHPPTYPPRILLPSDPNTLHDTHTPYTNQLPHTLPILQPLRPVHNPLPLHPLRPPNPSPRRPKPALDSSRNIQPHLPHNRSLPNSLLAPLVLAEPLPRRHRLPDRPIRRLTFRRRSHHTAANYPV